MSTKKIELNIMSKDSDDSTIPPPPPPKDDDDSSSDEEENTTKFVPKSPDTPPPPSPHTPETPPPPSPHTPETPPPSDAVNEQDNTDDVQQEKQEKQDNQNMNKNKKGKISDTDVGIFQPIIGETNIILPLKAVGKNIKEKITKNIAIKIEGKCNGDGFVKTGSTKIVTYSNGLLVNGDIKYKVVYEAYVCNPVDGHLVNCNVNNVTKAGIRATVTDGEDTPLVIFIARDHHYNDTNFLAVKEGDNIKVRIIGSRFELNDTYISIIGELAKQKINVKPRLKYKK